VTVADTFEELCTAAEEVLAFHTEVMLEVVEAIPEVSALDSGFGLDDCKDAVALLAVKAPDNGSTASTSSSPTKR
jgi:hypothetical protein